MMEEEGFHKKHCNLSNWLYYPQYQHQYFIEEDLGRVVGGRGQTKVNYSWGLKFASNISNDNTGIKATTKLLSVTAAAAAAMIMMIELTEIETHSTEIDGKRNPLY